MRKDVRDELDRDIQARLTMQPMNESRGGFDRPAKTDGHATALRQNDVRVKQRNNGDKGKGRQ